MIDILEKRLVIGGFPLGGSFFFTSQEMIEFLKQVNMDFKLRTEKERLDLIKYVGNLDLDKSKYNAKVSKKVIRRSISANNLYWLWLTCIAWEQGNDKDWLHQYYMEKFLSPTIKKVFEKDIEVYTTTDKSTNQFREYLDKIKIDALVEHSIKLPNPDDLAWDHFYDFYRDKM